MDLTVNPAYPSITNALLRGDILEEDYTQIDIASSETAQPSHSSSTSLTFNPAYPRVTNALLSSNILEEDYTEVDIVSNETAQRRSYSSSSSELSYEVQPALDYYEEIPDNIVSGVRSEQNCAYNITSDDPPPAYEEVVRSRANSLEDNYAYNTVDGMIRDNQEVYEVIPEREEEEDRTETYTPRALCGFWQGRVELAIRVTIITVSIHTLTNAITMHAYPIQLGLTAFVLSIMGGVTSLNGVTARVGLVTTLTTLFIGTSCIPLPLFLMGCVELGTLLTRICSKNNPESFLTNVSHNYIYSLKYRH